MLCSHVKGYLGSFAQGLKSDPLILNQHNMRDKLCSFVVPGQQLYRCLWYISVAK